MHFSSLISKKTKKKKKEEEEKINGLILIYLHELEYRREKKKEQKISFKINKHYYYELLCIFYIKKFLKTIYNTCIHDKHTHTYV